jgi:DNA gyrase subunit A
MLISDGGTVIRMATDGIKRSGRATQGVIVMRLREGEQVSSLAPVIGSDDEVDEVDELVDGVAEVVDADVAEAVETIDGDAD